MENFLLELIKFDMEQIRHYADIIIHIAVIGVAASFAVSAFAYGRDTTIDVDSRKKILGVIDFGIVLGLIIMTNIYSGVLNLSRAILEIREDVLKEHLTKNETISFQSLYPDAEAVARHKNRLNSVLEKFPFYISMVVIGVKLIIEISEIWIITYRKAITSKIILLMLIFLLGILLLVLFYRYSWDKILWVKIL